MEVLEMWSNNLFRRTILITFSLILLTLTTSGNWLPVVKADDDHAPVMNSIPTYTVTTGKLVSFTIKATDPDGDALTFSAGVMPAGASFDSGTCKFRWTPNSLQAGTYSIVFQVSDGQLTDKKTATIIVQGGNHLPILTPIPNYTVNIGQILTFTISANDSDGDLLTFTAGTLPSGAIFNSDTKTFTWTPTANQAGVYTVQFQVSDGKTNVSGTTTITVTSNTNQPPIMASLPNYIINEGQPLSFIISASDPDSDLLTYTAGNLPNGATFNSNTRTFSWTPTFSQAGTYTVQFQVSDGISSVTEATTIVVNNINIDTNQPPVFDNIDAKTVNEGALLQFTVNATDPDGDTLTYSTESLPSGATFDPITKTFSWIPNYTQAGNYQIHFIASDGDLTSNKDVVITVNNVNRAPVFDAISNQSVNENILMQFTVNATDPDGDTLTYTTGLLPTGAVFDQTTRTFSWTPDYTQAGSYYLHFTASDGNLTSSKDVVVTVNNINRVPVFEVIESLNVNQGVLIQFTVNATDPDNDTLIYSVENLPSGATFNSQNKTFSWTPDFSQQGIYQICFMVSDGKLTDSLNVPIIVTNQSPIVDILAPANNDKLKGIVTIKAQVNSSVNRVEFYLDGILKDTVHSAPFEYTINTSTYQNGIHTISLKGFNAGGTMAQSSITLVFHNPIDIQQVQPLTPIQ
jgi:hypothetical protein